MAAVLFVWGTLGLIFLVWLVAIPIGIYSAVHQYSIGDHMATAFGFFGIATPSFLLALVLMYLAYKTFGFNPSLCARDHGVASASPCAGTKYR